MVVKKILPAIVAGIVSSHVPSHSAVNGTVGLYSDYMFRGISQTDAYPAIQGNIDYSSKWGFYIGNFASNISPAMYNKGHLDYEIYTGWKVNFTDRFGIQAEYQGYFYPGASPNAYAAGWANHEDRAKNYHTHEVMGAIKCDPFYAQINYMFSDWFGLHESTALTNPDIFKGRGSSKGSVNGELAVTQNLIGSMNLVGAAGFMWVKNFKEYNYAYFNMGFEFALPKHQGDLILSVLFANSNADKTYYTGSANDGMAARDISGPRIVLSMRKAF